MTAAWDSECTPIFVFPKYLQEKPSGRHEQDAAMKLCVWEIHAVALWGWKGHYWHSYKVNSQWTALLWSSHIKHRVDLILHVECYFSSNKFYFFFENKMITSFPFPFTPWKLFLSYFSFSFSLPSLPLSFFSNLKIKFLIVYSHEVVRSEPERFCVCFPSLL